MSNEWRHNNGYLIKHTMRIAKEDFDTDPSDEYKKETFDYLCEAANNYEEQKTRIDKLEKVVEKATRAMKEAKVEPCWDKMPAGIHHKIDVIFKALSEL